MEDDFSPFEGTVTFDCADCECEITAGVANSCITLCHDCFRDMLAEEAAEQSYHDGLREDRIQTE